MSIDESITELEILKKNIFSYMPAYQAFTTAINIMRKYQKIQEIYKKWASADIDDLDAFREFKEVLEDGND